MKIALLKERKASGDARVLFSPKQLAEITQQYPQHQFTVESSNTRAFTDSEYRNYGIEVTQNLNDTDVLLGIKEVPLPALIPHKTYFFFSHTTKMQPHNKTYLEGLKKSQITFYDYENFTDDNSKRLISFGKNAGLIGAYQSMRTYGLKNKLFTLPSPSNLQSFTELYTHIQNIHLPPIKIVVTGTGNVGSGINEFLKKIGVQKVTPNDFLSKKFTNPVFTQLSKKDYLLHKETNTYTESDFIAHPNRYKSTFVKFAQLAELFIGGHYHHTGMPFFFTKDDIQNTNFKINTIGDISCDVHTPIPTCLRPSTPNDPIYGYNKFSESECNYLNEDSIAIMAVDNLPCELPRETSTDFGNQFKAHILDDLMTDLESSLLTKACVLKNGEFTKRYGYLNDFINQENILKLS